METQELLNVIDYWHNVARKTTVLPREIIETIDLSGKKVVDITGVRRSGKSYILRSLWQKVSSGDNALYINFEDPYFDTNNSLRVLERLIEVYQEYHSSNLKFVFWDEVQRIPGWERVVRKYEEGGTPKFVVTGSSADLLDGELATLLTGRHESYKVWPLSYKEYLQFAGIEINSKKDFYLKTDTLEKELMNYLLNGGFPEVILTKKSEYAKSYFGDILEKDIFARFDVRDKVTVRQMAVFLLSNFGNLVSQKALGRLYDLSFLSVKKYLNYFSESYLLGFLPLFSFSFKKSQKALKKVYAIDTGLAAAVSYSFSPDFGRILENIVYLELMRRNKEIFYYKTANGGEVDFIIREKNKLIPLQVCWDMADKKTSDRENKALKEAQKELKTKEGFILTAKTVIPWLIEEDALVNATLDKNLY